MRLKKRAISKFRMFRITLGSFFISIIVPSPPRTADLHHHRPLLRHPLAGVLHLAPARRHLLLPDAARPNAGRPAAPHRPVANSQVRQQQRWRCQTRCLSAALRRSRDRSFAGALRRGVTASDGGTHQQHRGWSTIKSGCRAATAAATDCKYNRTNPHTHARTTHHHPQQRKLAADRNQFVNHDYNIQYNSNNSLHVVCLCVCKCKCMVSKHLCVYI